MKEKLRKLLAEACKDMGLTEKGIETLCEIGAQGLTETSSDDDIKKVADSLVPYAKAMQGEITRKFANKPKPEPEPKPKPEPEPKPKPDPDPKPDPSNLAETLKGLLAPLNEKIDKLSAENEKMKAERAKAERSAQIAAKAKDLGLPDFLVKKLGIADDADIEKELTGLKQELVASNLMPKDAAQVQAEASNEMKAMAAKMADMLPDNK